MEEAKAKRTTKKSTVDMAEKIRKSYIDYLLEHGKEPASVYSFAKINKIKEEEFYTYYSSFTALEKDVWKGFLETTLHTVINDPTYGTYNSREKMLALYFTLIEVLKANRSYILLVWPKTPRPGQKMAYMESFKPAFKNFVNDILNEGKESGEIVTRPYISEKYDEAAWLQVLFLINFWVKDDSKAFEATDAAIEKSVNLAFDLFGQGPLDSIIDFGKFLFQHR